MSSSEANPQSDAEPEHWAFDAGDVLGRRYEIVERLAQGSFGEVHAAVDREQRRKVALKILHTEGQKRDSKAVARMRQEAEILRALNHPNLVQVYDIVAEGEWDFLVMELLEGRPLRELIDTGELANSQRARAVAAQMLSALDAMHSRDVQHRDLKPDNIILREAPNSPSTDRVKIVDFGIAKAREFLDQQHEFTIVQTQENEFVGTPRYASPEQAVGDPVDATTDLFAVGLVIAEWFTGEARIDIDDQRGVLSVLIQPDPIDVSDCPEEWQPWLRKMVAKSPEDRYQSAARAREELPGHDAKTAKYSKGRLERGFDSTDLPSTEIPDDSADQSGERKRGGNQPLTVDADEGTPDGTKAPPAIGAPGDPAEPTAVSDRPGELDPVHATEDASLPTSGESNDPPTTGDRLESHSEPSTPSSNEAGSPEWTGEQRARDVESAPESSSPEHSAREDRTRRARRRAELEEQTETKDPRHDPRDSLETSMRIRTAAAVLFFLVSLAIFGYSLFRLLQ